MTQREGKRNVDVDSGRDHVAAGDCLPDLGLPKEQGRTTGGMAVLTAAPHPTKTEAEDTVTLTRAEIDGMLRAAYPFSTKEERERLVPTKTEAVDADAAIERLTKALEPFAKAAVEHDGQDREEWRHRDDNELVESSDALTELTAGDFRRAAAALKSGRSQP